MMPTSCPGVPDELLDPKNTWSDTVLYDTKARKLAADFVDNFAKFADQANEEIMAAAPRP
jgi:phosphoenolpyruvate carboxykinase (ATP)